MHIVHCTQDYLKCVKEGQNESVEIAPECYILLYCFINPKVGPHWFAQGVTEHWAGSTFGSIGMNVTKHTIEYYRIRLTAHIL